VSAPAPSAILVILTRWVVVVVGNDFSSDCFGFHAIIVYCNLLQSPPLSPLLLRIWIEVRLSDRKTRRTGLSGCLVLLLRHPVEPSMARLRLGRSGPLCMRQALVLAIGLIVFDCVSRLLLSFRFLSRGLVMPVPVSTPLLLGSVPRASRLREYPAGPAGLHLQTTGSPTGFRYHNGTSPTSIVADFLGTTVRAGFCAIYRS